MKGSVAIPVQQSPSAKVIARWLCWLALAACLPSIAQNAGGDEPQLRTRRDNGTVTVTKRHASTSLPEDVSGEYPMGDSGSVVEISIEQGELDGYISKLGDLESDRGTPLTYFFARTDLRERRVSFVTRRVHGIWYSFEGSIVRGPARSRAEAGYYLLEGELVEHNAVFHQEQGRTVSLKSSRRSGNC